MQRVPTCLFSFDIWRGQSNPIKNGKYFPQEVLQPWVFRWEKQFSNPTKHFTKMYSHWVVSPIIKAKNGTACTWCCFPLGNHLYLTPFGLSRSAFCLLMMPEYHVEAVGTWRGLVFQNTHPSCKGICSLRSMWLNPWQCCLPSFSTFLEIWILYSCKDAHLSICLPANLHKHFQVKAEARAESTHGRHCWVPAHSPAWNPLYTWPSQSTHVFIKLFWDVFLPGISKGTDEYK